MEMKTLKNKRILYVEDDTATREEVAFFLENFVGELYLAGNGEEGIEAYRRYRPDLVISDIQMPVMDGMTMIETIRRIDPKVPVIVTTAFNENDHLLNAINNGVDRYILKPLNLKKMLEEIASLLYERSDTVLYQSLDGEGRFVEISDSWLEAFGYDRGEVVGHKISEFIPEAAAEQVRRHFDHLKEHGVANNVRFQIVRKDGMQVDVILNGITRHQGDGVFECTNCELRDIGSILHSETQILKLLDKERYLRGLISVHAQIGKSIASSPSLPIFLHEVTDAFRRLIEYEFAFIALREDESHLHIAACSQHLQTHSQHLENRIIAQGSGCHSPICVAVETGTMVIVDDLGRLPDFDLKADFEALHATGMIVLPVKLRPGGQNIGVLTLLLSEMREFSREELELFENIADTVGLGVQAIEDRLYKERLIRELDVQATTDALTGCANRHRGIAVCKEEVKRARRYERPLSLIYFDIDRFKSVNDTYGHDGGDAVLVAVAESMKEMVRASDLPVRWGGEEFIVLVPESDLAAAVALAEKLRRTFAAIDVLAGHTVTASFGVVQLQGDEEWDAMLIRADVLMYRAKQEGRDRVCHD